MADITAYLNQIKNAVFGKDVRDSIINALKAQNAESGTAYNQVAEALEKIDALKTSVQKQIDDNDKAINDKVNKATSDLNDKIDLSSKQFQILLEQARDAAEGALETVTDFELTIAVFEELLNSKIDDGRVTEDGLLQLLANGEVVAELGPFAGGAGSGGGTGGEAQNGAILSLKNATGWSTNTFAPGQPCVLMFDWSSIEEEMPTGAGTVTISVGGQPKLIRSIEQGLQSFDISDYLQPGTNSVRITVRDVYDNSRYIAFTIKLVAISLDAPGFDASKVFTGNLEFPYIPTGAITKVVHFLLDGKEIGTQTVSTSGRQQTYLIPRQSHGSHTLEVYFTGEVEGMPVESNHLFYDLMWIEEGNPDPVVAIEFNQKEVKQYDTINIKYSVYNPSSLTSEVTLREGDKVLNTLTVDRTPQIWAYRVNEKGSHTLTVESGNAFKSITFNAVETEVDVAAETNNLELYLSSYGRFNGEANPATWSFGDVQADFKDFNWISDGWQLDDEGITVLRVARNNALYIPFEIFKDDFRNTGKTIEFEFATRDVRDFDAKIIQCYSGDRGLVMTGQQAVLTSEQSEISIPYKEDEHVRVTFVVSKRANHRLIYIYIDGIMSGVMQYPDDDDFSQTEPVGITIGSDLCTVDLYCIRVYNNDLTSQQVLDNWIADTQVGSLMLDRFMHNDIFNEYGQIDRNKLPSDLPYMIWQGEELPQYKGNKLNVSGSYTDPVDSAKSFSYETSQIDVQGTSSAGYARKNFKQKFTDGILTNKGKQDAYALRDTSIPVNTFTFKADVASSEGANNVELVRLFNEACPVKHPKGSEYRWGIDGLPMVAFQQKESGTDFIGKYNFNNDKGTEEVYGLSDGDESWETLNNTDDLALYRTDDFSTWQNTFEARYPEDNTDISKLQAMVKWVKSTEGNVQKFKNELSQHFDVDQSIFYWLFTELFLMVDSRAKNAFPTYFAKTGKWYWLPYDFDTALGINNEGLLAFGYSLEDTDHLEGDVDVFNGQKSVFWNNLRDAFPDEIKAMYQKLRSDGALSFAKVEKMFEDHQRRWPQAVFNEDAFYKYLQPLIDSGNGSYLGMCQGSKSSQRKWWLAGRFNYMDAKYNSGDNLGDAITVRGYAKQDISVTPYADIYVNVKYGSVLVSERGKRNQTYTLACPLSNVNDTEIYIYGASQLSSVGDLSGLKVGYADFSKAVKLTDLKLGDGGSYTNPNLSEVSLGNNRLLKKVDLRNCSNFTQTVDLTGCAGIEEIYMEGTRVSGINLPNGGVLKVLHLPSTLTNLTILNHKGIEDLQVPDYSRLTTLRLENVGDSIPIEEIIKDLQPNTRVRLVGLHFEYSGTQDIRDLFDKFDSFRGLDEQGQNMDKAQVSGTIHVPYIVGSEAAELQQRYPYMVIQADHSSSNVFYHNWNGTQLLHTEEVVDGGDASWEDRPVRPNTDREDYEFNGWSLTPNGSANANAQKSVTTDRHLYAAYDITYKWVITYWNYDGTQVLHTEGVIDGQNGTYDGQPSRDMDERYTYSFTGWSTTPNGSASSSAQSNVTADRNLYAAYSKTERTFTAIFMNGTTEVGRHENIPWGGTAVYPGNTAELVDPKGTGQPFDKWDQDLGPIYKDTTFTAMYVPLLEVKEIDEDTFINDILNGTYKGKYKIGNYIKISVPLSYGGERIINMQIATKENEGNPRKDGQGNAAFDLIGIELVEISSYRNKDYDLINTWDYIPEKWKKIMKRINADETENDSLLWYPQKKDVILTTAGTPRYATLFPDAESRKKHDYENTIFRNWHLAEYMEIVTSTGVSGTASSSSATVGVPLCFSVG